MKRILQLFLLLGALTGPALAAHIDVAFTMLQQGDYTDIDLNPRALPIPGSPIFVYSRADEANGFARAGENPETKNVGIYGSAGTLAASLSIIFPLDVLQVQGTLNWTSPSGTGYVYAFPNDGSVSPVIMPSGQFTVAPGKLFNQFDIYFDDTEQFGLSDVNFEMTQLSYDPPNAPEPASMVLFGGGLLGLGFLRFRRSRS